MTDIAIQVEDLSKIYKIGTGHSASLADSISSRIKRFLRKEDALPSASDFWALKNLSFEIKKGDIVGIIGKNGAGKSTLLKILSRITEPSKGFVDLNGRVSSLLEVGTGFHHDLSGRENIFLNGTILGMKRPEIKKRFDEIVDFSGISKFLDTPVKRYSSGMYVRLAFAVAAHLNPDILIIDEVLAVGDTEFQKKCLGKMQDITKEHGRTILFVSHQMGAVRDLCNKGIMLKSGEIFMQGKTKEVIEAYVSENNKVSSNIEKREDREGDQRVVIKDIALKLADSGIVSNEFISGDNILIEIDYESKNYDNNLIQDLQFEIAIHNSLGQFTTVLNNKMSFGSFSKVPKSGKIFCSIPRNPLMFGNFTMTPSLIIDNQLSDKVFNAISFLVNEGDYYGTMTPNSLKRQGVYVEQKWSI